MKNQRFNKVFSALAANKAEFMSFVRHPSLMSATDIWKPLFALREVMPTREYTEMLSAKKTQDVAELKWKRDNASKAVRMVWIKMPGEPIPKITASAVKPISKHTAPWKSHAAKSAAKTTAGAAKPTLKHTVPWKSKSCCKERSKDYG